MKTIGLIGGMSWESTAHYYAVLNRETARLGAVEPLAQTGGYYRLKGSMKGFDFKVEENLRRQAAEAGTS